ncbi:MAG: hypothetical protein JWO59_2203 [Chloroflexi bacterium]|nr:hypothetical protein [Chloroflexota bacterium]
MAMAWYSASPASVAAHIADRTELPSGVAAVGNVVVPLQVLPIALADSARTGRVFLTAGRQTAPYGAAVIVLDAARGQVVATVPLTTTLSAGGGRSVAVPANAYPGEIGVDQTSSRVFVSSTGAYLKGNSYRNGMVFTLDATTGRVVYAATLPVASSVSEHPVGLVVDEQTNRVFVGYANTAKLSVLDATTGRLLRTVGFGLDLIPLGVDRRNGRVVVQGTGGLITVDERTGGQPRLVPNSRYAATGLVDPARGRALMVTGGVGSVGLLDSIDLATGKLVHFSGGIGIGPLVIDEATGRAVLYTPGDPHSSGPSFVSIVDVVTGRELGYGQLSLGGSALHSAATAVINPATRHALVLAEDDIFAGPIHLDVLDLNTGKILRVIRLPGSSGYAPGLDIVVDVPTRRVFVATTNETVVGPDFVDHSTLTVFDGTKL